MEPPRPSENCIIYTSITQMQSGLANRAQAPGPVLRPARLCTPALSSARLALLRRQSSLNGHSIGTLVKEAAAGGVVEYTLRAEQFVECVPRWS